MTYGYNFVFVSTMYTQTVISMNIANNVVLIQFNDGGLQIKQASGFGNYFVDSTIGSNNVLGFY